MDDDTFYISGIPCGYRACKCYIWPVALTHISECKLCHAKIDRPSTKLDYERQPPLDSTTPKAQG